MNLRRRRTLWVLAMGMLSLPGRSMAEDAPSLGIVGRETGAGKPDVWKLARTADDRTAAGTKGVFEPVFRAVKSSTWPPGLVPVFAVETPGGVHLRRVPMKGRENFSEPLFFALPPVDEPEAVSVAGRWTLVSRSQEGHQHRLAVELTTLGERVVGRFDQNTDYRFAFLTGGIWRSNRLELTVEYINDRYSLSAVGGAGRLNGEWRMEPDGDAGTWEAIRVEVAVSLPDSATAVSLVEWTRNSDSMRQYVPGDQVPEGEWERAVRPVCRVWLPED